MDEKEYSAKMNLIPQKQIFPPHYSGDSRFHGHYYVLPLELLTFIQRDHKLHAKLDKNSLQMDMELAHATDNLRLAVGFRNEVPLPYHLLGEHPLVLDDPGLPEFFDMTKEQVEECFSALRPKLGAATLAARAYNGWLLSNSDFLAGYRILANRAQDSIENYGFPVSVASHDRADGEPFPFVPVPNASAETTWLNDLLNFYKHWHIQGFTGPYLPLPLQKHFPVLSGDLSLNEYRIDSAAVSLPSIVPTPDATELRTELEWLARRKKSPDHLKPWMAIVEDANQQKATQLKGFEQRFLLAHFLRVFDERYLRQVKGVNGRVIEAFAEYLKMEGRTVERIRSVLRRSGLLPNTR